MAIQEAHPAIIHLIPLAPCLDMRVNQAPGTVQQWANGGIGISSFGSIAHALVLNVLP